MRRGGTSSREPESDHRELRVAARAYSVSPARLVIRAGSSGPVARRACTTASHARRSSFSGRTGHANRCSTGGKGSLVGVSANGSCEYSIRWPYDEGVLAAGVQSIRGAESSRRLA